MTMASLNASLLARKGAAQPAASAPLHMASVARIPQVSKGSPKRYATEKKSKKKHLRLGHQADRDLRLLAARNGMSQQAIMERAVTDYLEQAFADSSCICRR